MLPLQGTVQGNRVWNINPKSVGNLLDRTPALKARNYVGDKSAVGCFLPEILNDG